MQRATSVVRKAAVKQDRVVETLTLDHEDRNRRRVALKGDGGRDILLDLDKPTALNDGDAVKLEDGSLVLIRAAAQKLIEITAENPLRLARVAWHIGNRHTPAEITANAIYIEHDHVLAEMVRGQGCAMSEVERPFQPERGAYDHDHANCGHDHHGHHHDHDHAQAQGDACGCGHDHGHHGHGHEHGHAHGEHAHDHDHAHEHAHGASCGCGHDHNHDDHGHKHDHGHHGHEHGHKGHKHDH